jgi:UDP-glucose 4-epimerase
VNGCAGHIGAHACKALRAKGYTPVTFDSLSTGWQGAVKFGPLFKGNLLDKDYLTQVFERYKPEAVLHFATLSQVD